jgi:hypothetical protein
MQVCNCTVAIGGEAGMTVVKDLVTVPEIMVLRAIHGEDAVRNIAVVANEDIDSNEERSRLMSIYRMPEGIVKDTLGATGPLPKTIDDSGIGDEFVISKSVAKKSKKASATEELELPQEPAAEAPAE